MKKFLSLALAVVMIFSFASMASAKTVSEFSDYSATKTYIDSNKYYNDALQMMVDLELMTGRTDGSLDPAAPVNRLEFIIMLYKFTHAGQVAPATYTHTFSDVPWGGEYVGWAQSSGVSAGVGDGMFGSLQQIKHTEALAFVIKALGVKPEYEDSWAANWASTATVIADELQLIRDGAIANVNAMTRAEVAVLFYFALEAYPQQYGAYAYGQKQVRSNEAKTAISKYFDYTKYEAQVLANEYAAISGTKTDPGKSKIGTMTVPVSVPLNKLGFKVYYYGKVSTTSTTTIAKMTAINYTGNTEKTYGLGGISTDNQATAADVSFYGTGTLTSQSATNLIYKGAITASYKNYETYNPTFTGAQSTFVTKTSLLGGNNVRFLSNDYGKYFFFEDLTAVKISRIASDGAVTATKNGDSSTTIMSAIAANKISTDDTLAVGDYAIVAKVGNPADNIYWVDKAEVMIGSFNEVFNSQLIIAGKYYPRYNITGSYAYFDSSSNLVPSKGVDYNLYVFGNKVIQMIAVGEAPSETGEAYAYLKDFFKYGASNPTIEVVAYSAKDKAGKAYIVSPASSSYADLTATNVNGSIRKFSVDTNGLLVLGDTISGANVAAQAGAKMGFGVVGTALANYDGESTISLSTTAAANTAATRYSMNAGSVWFFLYGTNVRVVTNRPSELDLAEAVSTADGDITLWKASDTYGGFDLIKVAKVTTAQSPFADTESIVYAWGIGDVTATGNKTATFRAYNGTSVVQYATVADWNSANAGDQPTTLNGSDLNAYTLTVKNALLRLTLVEGKLKNIAKAESAAKASVFTAGAFSYLVTKDNVSTNADGTGVTTDNIDAQSELLAGAYKVLVQSIDTAIEITTTEKDTNASLTDADPTYNTLYFETIPTATKFYWVDLDANTANVVAPADIDLEKDGAYTYYMVWDLTNTRPSAIWVVFDAA